MIMKTDQYSSTEFKDNWDLSVIRANSIFIRIFSVYFVRILIKEFV